MSIEQYSYFFFTAKISSDQLGIYSLAKIFLYFEILTWSPTLNFRSFSLESAMFKNIFWGIDL